VVVIVGAVWLLSSGGLSSANAAPGVAVADEGRQHVPDGSPITYRHYPPASGPHYPTAQPWGVNSRAVAEGYWVHNLEHGGVVLLYKCAGDECESIAGQIRAIYGRLPRSKFGNTKLVATPYERMDSPFTLVAWGRQEALPSLDEAAVAAFYRAYVDRGPEDAP
jgi:hypothetical protein